MLRTHTCGELRISDKNKEVTLCGWITKIRNKGSILWIDIYDRYGLTQLVFDETHSSPEILKKTSGLGREFVIQAKGIVIERIAKNTHIPTGEIEIRVSDMKVLNTSKVPPFLIEDETDGGEDLRMKYRYLDLRRNKIRKNFEMRHKMMQETRRYLDSLQFIEVETPVLIKSTPEGARDFVVPSRMNAGEFYALPQSPQTFKQLLMVSGFDRYFQIVKCFRDEDLRADRQPEFTQIDCEMSYITEEDIYSTFEGLIKHLFQQIKNITIPTLPRMLYEDAMKLYGSDKPDIRFGMPFVDITDIAKGHSFPVFDNAELVIAICVSKCSEYTRKELDELTEFVKRPQIGSKGLVYAKYNPDGSIKSSVDKFYSETDIQQWMSKCNAQKGDLLLILCGEKKQTRKALGELRLEMGNRLGLRDKNTFAALWVTDFPLLEWDEETKTFQAMHHPFTSPKEVDILQSNPSEATARAYDMVINGVEVGGGSIRIHDKATQQLLFETLGISKTEAQKQFGFLLDAFEYGTPPHGGIAFGFDRLCSLMGGSDSIRDFIAFPKNNSGRDVMIDTPSPIYPQQLKELHIATL
ncbi:MAG: aspartate--tRNA ligase [Chitinophagaceae bacterium]|nr:aspartate--tRNA ligase [Chitinophagaceae bacterium]